jgi:hypothetical protein
MYRLMTAVTAVIAVMTLDPPSRLEAQNSAPPNVSTAASLLDVLARERAGQWSSAAPIVHCRPAPLTEQPGAEAERARPRVLPLETAFLDAVSVKRLMIARAQPPSR